MAKNGEKMAKKYIKHQNNTPRPARARVRVRAPKSANVIKKKRNRKVGYLGKICDLEKITKIRAKAGREG